MRTVSKAFVGVLLVLASAAFWPAFGSAAEAPPPAPANDNQASAQPLHGLPATLAGTTVGATRETSEAESNCGIATTSSVWYTLRTPAAERVAVDLAAGGALDGTIDVYHTVRSQLQSLGCQRTDSQGRASLSFPASKNGVYLIRVAALSGSQLAPFTLDVFLPTPALNPPGRPLAGGGASGQVDRIQNINAAYSVSMRAGVSYLINLANRTKGACVSAALFAPATRSFEEATPLLHIGCGGYRLFTPPAGGSGRYSLELTPRLSRTGVQRFHLQVAVAGAAETAPGLALGNYARARGHLNGSGVQVLRLYRLDVGSHSNLTLKLKAPDTADFNLQLRGQNGNVIECQCGSSGSQLLQHQLARGRYYAVVSVRDASAGSFTLTRESRTITTTAISFSAAHARPGQHLAINVAITPGLSGPVTVQIERFDPVFGWQFYRQLSAFAPGGRASLAFVPPAVGRWRAKASFAGSRTASPSAVGHRYLLVG
jgi:hypothetical protein